MKLCSVHIPEGKGKKQVTQRKNLQIITDGIPFCRANSLYVFNRGIQNMGYILLQYVSISGQS
jgi:hypothetical protein